jgi:hypothetical protein
VFGRHQSVTAENTERQTPEAESQRDMMRMCQVDRRSSAAPLAARQSRTWKLQWSSEGCKRIPDCSAAAMATNLIARSIMQQASPGVSMPCQEASAFCCLDKAQAKLGLAGQGQGRVLRSRWGSMGAATGLAYLQVEMCT